MSDFLFSTRPRTPGALAAVLGRYLAPVTAESREYHGPWGSLAVVRGPHDPPVVEEDERSLSVLVGEPIVRAGEEPAGLARTGARRCALHRLLGAAGETAWDEHLDGHFAALRVEKATGAGRVVTDLASFVPAFWATARGGAAGLVVGTHVDCVARAAGRNRDLDLVSAADLVANLSSTFPHTLFRGVEQLAPASERGFSPEGWAGAARAFWRPVEREAYRSRKEAAAALREGFAEDIRIACEPFERVGILLSGGEDARAVLGAVPRDTRVRAFTYADWENREVRVARSVARACRAEFVFGARDPDHYLAGLPVVASLVGSGQNFLDAHGWGFHERLGIRELPLVLGGLSSDSFLKATHSPREVRETGGRPFALPASPSLRPDLLREVAERRTAFRRWLAEMRPQSAGEWERLWPFPMRRHAANLHGNRRMFASHEPFHSNAVVKLAAVVPTEWKRHRALFHQAMRPFLARSWYVPHARSRLPLFGRWVNAPVGVGLRVVRLVRDLAVGEILAKQGPWPKWERLYRSEAAERFRRENPLLGSPVSGIFTPASEEEVQRSVQSWMPLRRFMLLQVLHLSARAVEA